MSSCFGPCLAGQPGYRLTQALAQIQYGRVQRLPRVGDPQIQDVTAGPTAKQ